MSRYEDMVREAEAAAKGKPNRYADLLKLGAKVTVDKPIGGMKPGEEYRITGVAMGSTAPGSLVKLPGLRYESVEKKPTGIYRVDSPLGTRQMIGRREFSDFAMGELPDRMPGANKTERAYGELLDLQVAAGEILRWWWQPASFRLATMENGYGDFYRPDFMIQRPDGSIEIHETKGFMRADSQSKLKLFACIYPFALFVAKKAAKRDGGEFTLTRYRGSLP